MSSNVKDQLQNSDAMDGLRNLVRRNLTEAQRDVLVQFGTLDAETGLLNLEPVKLSKTDEVPLPMGTQKAVPFKGRIIAPVGPAVVEVKMFKDKGGQTFAASNILGAVIKEGAKAGTRWTTYIPNFRVEQTEERGAWAALLGLIPKYAEEAGWV